LALHGWDNDQDTQRDVNMKTLFDDSGDDDDLLVGFQRRFPSAAALPAGAQVARSDDLEIRYRIDSGGPRLGCLLSPPLPPPDGPPVPPAGKPDLVISELQATENRFTVKNQGSAAAGKFSVTATGFASFQFSGLSAGESESRTYATDGCQPTTHEIRADSLSEVNESDETNNVASLDVIC
jgi:hypothetical protein